VWFWGEGAAPERLATPYAVVYADDPFARGLGRLSGIRVAEPPGRPSLVDFVDESQSVLVVLSALTRALRRGDEDAWTGAARGYDETWFAEISEMLERFGTVRIVLPAHHETRVATLQPKARWRWFRARAALNDANA
jgi:hypothetical protein